MSGKIVVFVFLSLTIVSAVGMSLWIKQAYDTRPDIKIEKTEK